jgi:hypothetical protein
MDYIIAAIVSAVVVVFLTAVTCRATQARHRRARWSFAFIGALFAGIFTVVAVDWWELLHLGDLVGGKCPVWVWVLFDFTLSAVPALVLTSLVVYHYRTKFGNDEV